MKTYLSLALLAISAMDLQAQPASIKVPGYTKGVYAYDTIYNYSGPMKFGELPAQITIKDFQFVTGLKFYVMLEGTGSRYDSSTGLWVPINKDEKLSSPIMFRGGSAFHLVVEGTPETASETYPCELTNSYTLGEEFGVIFHPSVPEKTCVVDLIKGITNQTAEKNFLIYPNPVENEVFIKAATSQHYRDYELLNIKGELIRSGKLEKELTTLQLETLPSGNYFLRIRQNPNEIYDIIKK